MPESTVAVVGGTGFIGSEIADRLTAQGYRLKVITRRVGSQKIRSRMPELELVQTSVHDPAALGAALEGAHAVISMAGVLHESSTGEFDRVHRDLPASIARACAERGIPRLIHIGSLGAGMDAPSAYLRSKGAGEAALDQAAEAGVAVTILRPSVVFGPHDDFLNRFADVMAWAPLALPLACGNARFAPVYVGDVAAAAAHCLQETATHAKAYNLCGPGVYTLKQLVQYVAQLTERRRLIIALGTGLSLAQAHVMQLLPVKLLTVDNVRSMQVDNVCTEDHLALLGIQATPLEEIAPGYLGRKR